MAVKIIRQIPDPVLRRKTRRVLKIDKSVIELVEDMMDTLEKSDGAGLAAPQIGVSLRVAVLWMPEEEPFAIINPEVVKRIGEREVEEGCLSLPGYQGKIKRSVSVTIKCLDIEGKPLRIRAKELLAQALEHEIDHLNGVLYIDHLESPDKLYKIEPKTAEQAGGETPKEGLVIGSPAPPASEDKPPVPESAHAV
ncbi:MAG: peptide deformylase [Dehalococcoidia bacterium]|nr:MAG: peptide deformylase [Dehalococcoidia bacterium]